MKKTLLIVLFLSLEIAQSYSQTNSPQMANTEGSSKVLHAIMTSPKYRNAIYSTMQDPDVIKIKVMMEKTSIASYHIDVVLKKDDSPLKSWTFPTLENEMVLELAVSDITFDYTRSGAYIKDDDPYIFTITLKEDNDVTDEINLDLNKYPAPPAGVNEVRLDDKNNLVINGERKVMYGSYLFHYNKDWYSYLEGIGLNAFIEWGSQLTGGYHSESTWGMVRTNSSNGYSDIEGVRKNIISVRENSHLWGYRTVDEPNSHSISAATCQLHYQAAKEEDPYHPSYIVIKYKDHQAQHYPYTGYTDCADAFILDVYAIYKSTSVNDDDIGVVSDNYKYLRDSKLNASDWELEDMATMAAPQLFQQSHWILPHNNGEFKNLMFQHIVGGAKSFLSYSYENVTGYNNIFEYYAQTLVPTLKSMEDAIYAEDTKDEISVSSTNDSRLTWTRRITDDKEYLFFVNTTSKWNEASNIKDQLITVNVTFKNNEEGNVYSVVKDADMPSSYTIKDNKITIDLEGLNNTSSGVLVLYRELNPTAVKENQAIGYSLDQNQPNPFNSTTEIKFSIPENTKINLSVFNVWGQKVAELVNQELNMGSHSYLFDGSKLTPGLYFYKLQSCKYTKVNKMILAK